MNFEVKYPLVVAAVYLWLGFICAISFMEAWLKFRAPGVDVSTGLGIGRLVFNALNKAEWIFVTIIILNFMAGRETFLSASHLFFYLPATLLILQTFWLLPALDKRTELYIQGQYPGDSHLHLIYVVMEFIKVFCLVVFSIKLFK